jgi:hypothetical protein
MEDKNTFETGKELPASSESKERAGLGESVEKEISPERENHSENIRRYLSELQQTTPSTPIRERDELAELETMSHAQQVGALIAIVYEMKGEKGIRRAFEIAKSLKNPAILDEFRDTLADQHFDDLVRKGIIKEKDLQ